jgi:stage V sporulation protein SpoVS
MSRPISSRRLSQLRLKTLSAAVGSTVLLVAGGASAVTTTYAAGSGKLWNDGTAWNNGVPTSADLAVVDGNAGVNSSVQIPANYTANAFQLTIDGGDNVTLNNNSTLNLTSALAANNTFLFNCTTSESYLNFTQVPATITGTINFNYQTGSSVAGVIQGPGSGTILSTANIFGVGTLRNIRFTNGAGGILDGNDSRGQLYLDANNGGAGLFINNGTIRATAGGTVTFTGDFGGDFVSTGGAIQANGAGSVVRLINSASVTGGTYSTSGGGVVVVDANQAATATGFTLTAGSTFQQRNNTRLYVGGTVTNNGTIQFLSTNTSESYLTVNADTTLAGTGVVQMDWSNVPGTAAGVIDGSGTLTISSGQTIRGVGSLRNLKVNNAGLIDANSAAALQNGALYIDPNNGGPGLFTNNGGTVRSSNTGLLQITGDNGGDFNNTGGTIAAIGNGSVTELVNSASVTGGTLTTTGTGIIRIRSGQVGYVNGTVTITPGSKVAVFGNNTQGQGTFYGNGTWTNTGSTIEMNAAGAVALLSLNGNLAINGGTLSGVYTNISNSAGPRIDTGGNTLTIGATTTAQGVIYFNNARVINNGTLTANNAAGMYVDPNNNAADLFVNNNIMEATAGGLMQLAGDNGGNVLNNGTIRAVGAGAIVDLINNVSVTGGTITTSGGGLVRVRAGQVASLVGPATVSTGSQFTVQGDNVAGQGQLNVSGSYTLNGTLDLNAAGAVALLNVAGNTTLGSGTLRGLYTNVTGSSPGPRIDTGGNTLTISSASTVQGVVFFSNARVINNGTIDANSNVAGMYVDANNFSAGLIVNNSVMRSSAGGLLQLTGDNGGDIVNNGTISSTGAGSVTELVNSVAVTGGTWTNTSGGVIRVRAGNTASLITPTISAGSTVVVAATVASGGAQLNLTTSLTGPGTLELQSFNTSSPVLSLTNNVTVGGGATILGSYGTSGSGGRIDGGTNRLTIASGATVRGVVNFNNLTVTNNGTINADNHVVPSALGNADMYIDANNGGTAPQFVNNGTLSATNGAYLYLTGDNGGTFGGTGPVTVTGTSQIVAWNSAGGDMGPVSGTGTFIASNSANLGFQSYRIASLQATNSGVARVTAGATPGLAAGTSKVGTIAITNSGRVDLTNNGLIVTGMTQAAVRGLVAPGRNGGQWNGPNGIGSSLAFNNGKAVGYALASDLFAAPGTFLGQSFALTDVLVRYTLAGDSTLDGTVNFNDLLKLAANYNATGTATWIGGDYNYDGNTNFDDLLILAANYNKTVTGSFGGDWALATTGAVPEPTSIATLVAAGAATLRRRRR